MTKHPDSTTKAKLSVCRDCKQPVFDTLACLWDFNGNSSVTQISDTESTVCTSGNLEFHVCLFPWTTRGESNDETP